MRRKRNTHCYMHTYHTYVHVRIFVCTYIHSWNLVVLVTLPVAVSLVVTIDIVISNDAGLVRYIETNTEPWSSAAFINDPLKHVLVAINELWNNLNTVHSYIYTRIGHRSWSGWSSFGWKTFIQGKNKLSFLQKVSNEQKC